MAQEQQQRGEQPKKRANVRSQSKDPGDSGVIPKRRRGVRKGSVNSQTEPHTNDSESKLMRRLQLVLPHF